MDDNKEQLKTLLYIMVLLAVCFTMGSWYATQAVAEDCHYHTLLGSNLSIGNYHIYQPYAYLQWRKDVQLMAVIPDILRSHSLSIILSVLMGAAVSFMLYKSRKQMDSHGTAKWATAEDIKKAELNAVENGVVVGKNPFTKEIMLDNGPAHLFLAAPTRSGKGVGIIMPTAITWHNSAIFFDPKEELWIHTAGYRQKYLKQKVIKFEPLCVDGSGARWNPYAEIDFRGLGEMDDVAAINETIVKRGDNGNNSSNNDFWENGAIGILNGVTLHLLYQNYREKKPIPCPSDVNSFLSSPTMSTDQLFTFIKIYPHISKDEFLEKEYEEKIKDEKGNEVTVKRQHKNPLKEIYGEYISDLKPYKKALGLEPNTPEWDAVTNLEELRQAILAKEADIHWDAPDISNTTKKEDIEMVVSMCTSQNPFYQLLVHPKVAEAASLILNNAKETGASLLSSATVPLNLYQNPLLKLNTCVSDFCFKDLLNPEQAVTLYLVVQPNDVTKLAPLTRLFVNTMLSKTVRDMNFDVPMDKKQRLLMMLDEFPQLKKLDNIENTLAICAGYGIKICTVVQSITQINQLYSKDNSILDNSQTQIYMGPSNLAAAKELSEIMGEQTIKAVSTSNNGKFFSSSSSSSEQGRKLMNPDELLRMSKGKEIIMAQGCRPILCPKIRWYQEPFFKKRIKNPAYPSPAFSDTCTEVKTYEQLFAVRRADVAARMAKIEKVTKARNEAENIAKNELCEKNTYVQNEHEKESDPNNDTQNDKTNEFNTVTKDFEKRFRNLLETSQPLSNEKRIETAYMEKIQKELDDTAMQERLTSEAIQSRLANLCQGYEKELEDTDNEKEA